MMRHCGVPIPATNTTVEIEDNRLLPPTLQVTTRPSLPASLTILRTRLGCSARHRWKSCV